jgi:hypothetical protein
VSSHYIPGSGNGASASGGSFSQRRDGRSNGANPTPSSQGGGGRAFFNSLDFEGLIAELRALFERDRQIASQPDSARCGICYLYHRLSELSWRDEGFYVCRECERLLGKQQMPMLRKQQKQS